MPMLMTTMLKMQGSIRKASRFIEIKLYSSRNSKRTAHPDLFGQKTLRIKQKSSDEQETLV